MTPSVYIDLEDDVAKIVARVKKVQADSLILVCPKRCQLFADSINLRLLKKQTELLKKDVAILTMDERGQLYAKEAGFALRFLPKGRAVSSVSDIQARAIGPSHRAQGPGLLEAVKNVGHFVSGLVSGKEAQTEREPIFEAARVLADPLPAKKQGWELAPKAKSPGAGRTNFRVRPLIGVKVAEKGEREGPAPRRVKRFSGAALSLVLALSLLVVLALVLVVLPAAVVVAYPRTEPVTRDYDVNLDPTVKNYDVGRLVLSEVKAEETLEVKAKFKSQGKKAVGNKAIGNVRLYNFTGKVLNLKAATTVLTAGGRTYYLTEDAMQIRPTKYKDAQAKELDEKSLNSVVEATASAGGEGFNLPAGVRLEISNQVFGSRPQLLYAKTETPLSGGTSRFLSIVSDSDIAAAQTELAKQAVANFQTKYAALKLSLTENAYRADVIEFSADKPAGAESPQFEARLKTKITALLFSPEQLKQLIAERIGQTLSQNRYLRTGSDFNLVYKIKTVDLNSAAAVLAVHFEGKTVMKVDLQNTPSQLLGKSRQQASEVLQSMPEIEKAEVTLSPSWQTSFPWFVGKIKIQLSE